MTPQDDFDTAWDSDELDTEAAEAGEHDEPDEGEAETSDGPDEPETDHDGEGEEPEQDAEAAEGEADAKEGEPQGEASDDDIEALRKKLQENEHKMKSWEGRLSREARERQRLAEENEQLKQRLQTQAPAGGGPDNPDTQRNQPGTADGPNADTDGPDDEDLQRFRDEFGDEMADFIEKRARKIADERAQSQVSALSQRLTPLEEAQQQVAQEQHARQVQEAHSDAMDLVQSGAIEEWIDAQPSFLATSMRQVYEQGSTDEVIELLNRYKAENPPEQPSGDDRPANPRAAKARAVRSRSGGPPQKRAAADDFDAAWDQF
ncbi:hypothetical protein [Thioalkalivibrio sp. ALE12]|uniref:hypothetical protein n=1 Tax=Thioalkalivibrio sp. ALE12 TaxID=1158170 RepID=UPI00037F9394|nr:hypothetical protein [Thioalkalivibrio sp. ALE12]